MTLDQMRDAIIIELTNQVEKAYLEGYCHAAIEYKRPNLPNMDKVLGKAEHDWKHLSAAKEFLDYLK